VVRAEALFAIHRRIRARAAAQGLLAESAEQLPPELTFRCQALLAKIALSKNDHRTALRHLEQAMTLISLFGDDANLDLWSSFLIDKDAIFLDGVATALRLREPLRALSYLDRQRTHAEWARWTPRSDRLAQLLVQHRGMSHSLRLLSPDAPERDGVQHALANLSQEIIDEYTITSEKKSGEGEVPDLQMIQSQLSPKSVVLAYAVLNSDIEIFVLTQNSISTRRIARGTQRLARLSADLAETVEAITKESPAGRQRRYADMQALLHRLWDLLIEPVVGLLPTNGERLIIVPHGMIHSLPLAALFDGHRYLIERWQLQCVAQVQALAASSPAEVDARPMLAFGISHGQLHHAPQEARHVAEIMHGAAMVEHDATVDRFLEMCAGRRYLHIATHGTIRFENPYASFMLLSDGPLHPVDIQGTDLRGCHLVTLSGCKTALGSLRGGDAQIGLVQSFGVAGAENVMATLWPVADRPMRQLMESFYRHLADDLAPATALCQAQLECLHDPASSSPFLWGGVQLISFGR
jgi:CHAT domain-containing protein